MILLPKLPFVLTVVTDGWYGDTLAFVAIVLNDEGGLKERSAARLEEARVRGAANLNDKEKAWILTVPEVADHRALCEQFWEFWMKWLERQPIRLQFVYDSVLHPGAIEFFRGCVRMNESVRKDFDPMKIDVATLLLTHGHDPRISRFTIARMVGGEVGDLAHLALAIATCNTDMQKIIEGTL